VDGIYTLWAQPRPDARAELTRLELLLLVLSVLEWRRWNGPATLYCDQAYARYLDRIGLIDLWDRVDDGVLSSAIERDDDQVGSFWTIGRTLAIATADVPFASVDCDLIAWRSLADTISGDGIAFTHWESTEVSPWYPHPGTLHTPESYDLDLRRDWTRRAANVSLAYFGSAAVRDAYVTEVLRFGLGNPAEVPNGLDVAPELLFADQRLLPVIAAEFGVPAVPVVDAVWSPRFDRFVQHDPRFGPWDPLAVADQPTGITHAWFHKNLLEPHDPRLIKLGDELTAKLWSDHTAVATALKAQSLI
jgi:hypothetical protein